MKQYEFAATLKSAGGGVFVDFPFSVEQEFGVKGQVKIKCTIDNEPYQGSLANMGTGCHILIVLKSIRERINKQVGDSVNVILEQDLSERVLTIPPDLEEVLSQSTNASAFFNKLSYSHRREYIKWIEEAKKDETRAARINKTISMLLDEKKLK